MTETPISTDRCPAEQLASHAAKLIRAYFALPKSNVATPKALSDVPDLTDNADALGDTSPTYTRECLRQRIGALLAYAQCVFATSRKGGLFQAYVMARADIDAIRDPSILPSRPGETEGDAWEEERRRLRSWASILDALDDAEDEDLKAIRAWCFDAKQVKIDQGEGVIRLLHLSAA